MAPKPDLYFYSGYNFDETFHSTSILPHSSSASSTLAAILLPDALDALLLGWYTGLGLARNAGSL